MSTPDLLAPAKAKSKPISAADMRHAMLKTWAAPEYAIMWEVGEATGAAHTKWADAVIMSLWPSRGLELHGVEIKVSRGDWRREALNPRKAEAIGKYCDRWWIHTSPGVIADIAELPPLWGWRVWDGARWKTMRDAGINPEPEQVNRRFLAALLRRADVDMRRNVHAAAQAQIDADQAAFEQRIKSEVERRTARNSEAIKVIEEFEAASGLTLQSFLGFRDAAEIGALVKVIQAAGLTKTWQSLGTLRDTAVGVASTLVSALDEAPFDFPETPELQRKLAAFRKVKK